MTSPYMNDDAVMACAYLVGRAGASDFEIGYRRNDVPVEEAGWYATAKYQQADITTEEHRSPSGAALALAERLLAGAACRCRQKVTLSDRHPGCRWRLVGQRWEPGCDAPPIVVDAERGDHEAIVRALAEPAGTASAPASPRPVPADGSVQLIPEGGVDRIPPFDPRSGEHYWILPVVFHVADPAAFMEQPDGPLLMDQENLVLTTPLGCYYCEEMYSPRLASRRCKGESR